MKSKMPVELSDWTNKALPPSAMPVNYHACKGLCEMAGAASGMEATRNSISSLVGGSHAVDSIRNLIFR